MMFFATSLTSVAAKLSDALTLHLGKTPGDLSPCNMCWPDTLTCKSPVAVKRWWLTASSPRKYSVLSLLKKRVLI